MKGDTSIYLDILNNIKTAQDLNALIQEIDNLTRELFESRETPMGKIFNSVNANFASQIIQAFSANNLEINDTKTLLNFLKALKDLIMKFKSIKIVLAFDPNREIIKRLYNFTKESLGNGYILDIEVSEDILGGAIISFEGKYSDGSLKKRIEDTLASERKNIMGLAN